MNTNCPKCPHGRGFHCAECWPVQYDSRTMNDRLKAAGIKTTHTMTAAYLHRNGVTVKRPNVEKAQDVCLAVFNVVI